MSFSVANLRYKALQKIKSLIGTSYQKIRKIAFRYLSDCSQINGRPVCNQPLLCRGAGNISFASPVYIGVSISPAFYSSYAYIEARKVKSNITIGKNVWLNNNFCAISEGDGISIGEGTLIGTDVCVFDSDFHELAPEKRTSGVPNTGTVCIGTNVFIGSRVIILKGVTIGDNSVVAAGSVVSRDIPPNVIAGGNPCSVLKKL